MSVEKRFSISLDVKQPTSNRDIEVVEGDTGNVLVVTLTDNGQAVDLTGCKVCAVFAKPNGKTAMQDTDGNGLTVAGEKNNEITIELYSTSFSPGMVTCEIQVYSGVSLETLITSAQFNFKCRRGIANVDTIQATEEWPWLVEMLNRVEDAEDELIVLNEETTEAAARADEATTRANAAAENADKTAQEAAESAVSIAQEAADRAEEAARKAAEDAALVAGEAADRADAATDAANAAEATRAAAEAERQRRFAGISAIVHPLPAGYDPTANWNDSGDLPVLELGMPKPKDGKDAVNVSVSGMYYMQIVGEDLHVVVPDGTEPPPLSINGAGDLIYTIQ